MTGEGAIKARGICLFWDGFGIESLVLYNGAMCQGIQLRNKEGSAFGSSMQGPKSQHRATHPRAEAEGATFGLDFILLLGAQLMLLVAPGMLNVAHPSTPIGVPRGHPELHTQSLSAFGFFPQVENELIKLEAHFARFTLPGYGLKCVSRTNLFSKCL